MKNGEARGRVGQIIGYACAGIALLLAIGCFVDHMIVAGVLLVAAAALATPLLWNFWGQWMPSNVRTGVAIAVGFAGFVALGITAPQSRTGLAKSDPAPTPTAARAEAQAKASPTAEAKAAFRSVNDRVMELGTTCDKANGRAVDALNSLSRGGTIFDAYGAAKDARETCQGAWSAMGEIDVPDALEGDAETKTEAAIEKCRDAYLARAMSLETLMEVIDGDQKPSTVEKFKERGEAAQAGTLVCVGGLFEAAGSAGVDLAKEQKAK